MQPDKLIPLLFIILISIFMLLDGLFICLAEKTYTGPSIENAYKRGSNDFNNKTIAYEKLDIDITYTDQILEIHFSADNRIIQKIQKVEAKLIRPVTQKFDKKYLLAKVNDNNFSTNVGDLEKGQWEIRLKIYINNNIQYYSKRIINY